MSIVAENFTVSIRKDQPILSELNLQIEDGELVVVLGTSGSGKSFFSLCLNGIVPQLIPARVSGSLTVNGHNPSEKPVSEMATDVGIVFQDPDAQLIAMHVEDEIVFGPENLLMEREEISERLRYSLDMVEMWDLKDVHTWALSGGQKQRVAIGSVLSMQPSILVLDEPTSNLDPEGTRSIFNLLARLRTETNMTIIAIEHKLDELIDYVDRLLVLHEGKIIVNGPPREMLAEHGRMMMQRGINLPQVTELALRARWQGLPMLNGNLPLTEEEANRTLPVAHFTSRPPAPNGDNGEMVTPIIRFQDVWFNYPGRPPALKEIDLDIYPGEVMAIVGQNGAGKTTLTKLIVGLLKATRGSVALKGEEITRMPIERLTEKVGYVFQYPDNQLVTDTVFDEVAFSMRIRGMDEEKVTAKVEEVLQNMELADLAKRHPLTLSMGEKRRLSVATMLVLDQEVLILDEPTMGMDWGHIKTIMRLCRTLQEQGRTIIMVTHDMRVVGEWADRVIAMSDGQIILDNDPRAFFLDVEGLEATRLTQLPICPWRDCRLDPGARCQTCSQDFLDALLNQYDVATKEASR